MFDISIVFDRGTGHANVNLPVVALLKMFNVITDKLHPDDLDNADSVGEAVLIEFIQHLFKLNDQLLKESHACDVEEALDEVARILDKTKED